MGENKGYITHVEELGSIHISEDVVASVAGTAAYEIEGISGMMHVTAKKGHARGVRISVENDCAVLDLFVIVRYGFAIPEIAEKVQNHVISSVESMTGFSVKAVNIHVGGMSFNEKL